MKVEHSRWTAEQVELRFYGTIIVSEISRDLQRSMQRLVVSFTTLRPELFLWVGGTKSVELSAVVSSAALLFSCLPIGIVT